MGESTPFGRIRTWIVSLPDRLDRIVFRDLDLRATARGWQVLPGPRFRRTYRDPRWDGIRECPRCHGEGVEQNRRCPECAGDGTVRRLPTTVVGSS